MFNSIAEISVEELALRLADNDENLQLIDVRERQEVEIAYIEGFTVLPLSEYQLWEKEIKSKFDPEKETLVICHHGMRSAQMCQWLRSQDFSNVKNIIGGIEAYSILVDSTIPRY
jgi:rhodanese-related sulfurtransferase